MIYLYVNNGGRIELKQHEDEEGISMRKYNSNGELERADYISAGDMVMLLNYYQYQKDNGKEIF